MKKIFLIAFSVLLLCSCKKTTTEELLPVPKTTVKGVVALFDSTGARVPNATGVTVSIDSTTFTTTTDSDGNYTINNVAQGEYTITCSKTGYSTYKATNQFVLVEYSTTNIPPVYLYAPSIVTITNLTVQNSDSSCTISYTINPPSNFISEYVTFFISTSSTVSPSNYIMPISFVSSYGSTITTQVSSLYQYFPSGSTVYIVAYGSYSGIHYTSPSTGKIVYAGGLCAKPSNIASVTLP